MAPQEVQPSGGWSGAFRATASDGRDWFVKALDTCPPGQDMSVASEFIVGRVGALIGAPVCPGSLIRIPPDLDGVRPRSDKEPVRAGLAHATLALEHADERGRPALVGRPQDDNRRRHVGIFALFDWCFGDDPQWVYDLDNDLTTYSHDHGLYLPPVGQGGWTVPDLLINAHVDHELPLSRDGLLPAAVGEMATALESVTRDTLVQVMNAVPAAWPATDADLEALGWFLENRAPAVAARVSRLVSQTEVTDG